MIHLNDILTTPFGSPKISDKQSKLFNLFFLIGLIVSQQYFVCLTETNTLHFKIMQQDFGRALALGIKSRKW
jgi:hypothetical protein